MSLFPNLPQAYYPDCTLLDILFKGYMATVMREPNAFDKERLPEFIYNRLESMIIGVDKTNDFLLDHVLFYNCVHLANPKRHIEGLLDQAIQSEKGPSERLEVYTAIKQEIIKPTPDMIILESLLFLLAHNVEQTDFTKKLLAEMKAYSKDL